MLQIPYSPLLAFFFSNAGRCGLLVSHSDYTDNWVYPLHEHRIGLGSAQFQGYLTLTSRLVGLMRLQPKEYWELPEAGIGKEQKALCVVWLALLCSLRPKVQKIPKWSFAFFCLYTSVYSRNLNIMKGGRDKAGFRFPGHPYFCYHTNAIPQKDPKHATPQREGNGESNQPVFWAYSPDVIFNPSFHFVFRSVSPLSLVNSTLLIPFISRPPSFQPHLQHHWPTLETQHRAYGFFKQSPNRDILSLSSWCPQMGFLTHS